MSDSELVAIRSFVPADWNFILASWLRGLYYGNEMFGAMPQDAYYSHYHSVIEGILASPGVTVRVACLESDPDTILGYAVIGANGSACHWVFVKKRWRGIGIAKSLVPASVKTATHLTKVGTSIIARKGIAFNPFIT